MLLKILLAIPIGVFAGLGLAIAFGSVPIPACEQVTYLINSDVSYTTFTVRQGVCIFTFNGRELLPWIDRRWLISGGLISASLIAYLWANAKLYPKQKNPAARRINTSSAGLSTRSTFGALKGAVFL